MLKKIRYWSELKDRYTVTLRFKPWLNYSETLTSATFKSIMFQIDASHLLAHYNLVVPSPTPNTSCIVSANSLTAHRERLNAFSPLVLWYLLFLNIFSYVLMFRMAVKSYVLNHALLTYKWHYNKAWRKSSVFASIALGMLVSVCQDIFIKYLNICCMYVQHFIRTWNQGWILNWVSPPTLFEWNVSQLLDG